MAMNSPIFADRIFLGALNIQIKGPHWDCTLPARFYFNYQRETDVWAEVVPTNPRWLFQEQVEVTSPGRLEPFAAVLGCVTGKQSEGTFSISAEVVPLRVPIESSATKDLRKVTFALLDSPIVGHLISEQRPKTVTFPCGQFQVNLTEPTDEHLEVAKTLGSSPHTLNNSGTITERNDQLFSSSVAQIAIETLHDVLSFAAGRWVGMTLVEAVGVSGDLAWFRWGTTRTSGTSREPSWYDPQYPEWLHSLCDGVLALKSTEETWEPIRTALYWYVRSNTRGAGIDGSLILSQCALELLSWFVIVKKTGALSEEGYGQLSSASEKLRLALTLLGIPRQIPKGLKRVIAFRTDWKDIADAVVQSRNYLVHPTQSRSGKRQQKRDYPWDELWIAAQWLLELVLLRLFDYSGSYRNRTRLREFNAVERVPWA